MEVCMEYDFEEERVKKFLRENSAKKAAVQLPSGLKSYWREITETFHSAGVEPILMGSCYGGCDIADAAAKQMGCDVLVHYGHADIGLKTSLPTLHVEARVVGCEMEGVKSLLKEMNGEKVGLLTTVQFIDYLDTVKKIGRECGVELLIGAPGSRTKYPGQILGCDFSSAKNLKKKVGVYLYIGTGEFHPLGVSIATGKKVVAFDPISSATKEITKEEFLRKRKATITMAAMGEKFGVVTSTKPGQWRIATARRAVEELRKSGKLAELLVVDEITPQAVGDYRFDCLVCAACPRIPIDDQDRFEVPIITPWEMKVMLGQARFSPYQMDEF
ncbi:MAG: diphthamide biosynthesis enzyme Dph2 [Candidatus Hadarchaeales archaeon]